MANLNPNEPGFIFGTIQTPQSQTGAIALPTNVAQTGVTFQNQQSVVASTDAITAVVPEIIPPQPTVPRSQNVPTSADLTLDEGIPAPQVSLSHITQEEMTRMTDTTDPMKLFINQQQYNWENFSNEITAQFPEPLASSEPRYPTLS